MSNTIFDDATSDVKTYEAKKRRASFRKGATVVYCFLRDSAIWYLIYKSFF